LLYIDGSPSVSPAGVRGGGVKDKTHSVYSYFLPILLPCATFILIVRPR